MPKKKVRKNVSPRSKELPWRPGPIKGSFMALSIIGFLISTYLVYPKSVNYGTAFTLVFIAMFIASIISMTQNPIKE
jgi:hypothetical protein